MFSERKIESFEQRVSDLPDTPALSAAALKARFDACPEELRAALNGVCDDGQSAGGSDQRLPSANLCRGNYGKYAGHTAFDENQRQSRAERHDGHANQLGAQV